MRYKWMKFPVIWQYADCMKRSLWDRGDGLHISRRGVLISHHATTVYGSLTGGIFSTTLLLLLLGNAASEEYIYFIALNTAVMSFAGMAQFLSPLIFERMKRRRRMIYFLTGIYHVINIAVLPALVMLDIPTSEKAYLYIGANGVMSACSSLCAPAYSVWMMHSLPEECRSDYLVFQNMTTELLLQVTSLLLAVFMDFFKAHDAALIGILIMRGCAVAAAVIQYLSRNRMIEPQYNRDIQKVTLYEIVHTPLSSKPFLFTVGISMLWTFGVTFAGTYYSAYLLDGANLSYTYISICGLIGIPLNILMLPKWNKAIRDRGWLPALSVSMMLYGICYAINGLVTEQTVWVYLLSTVYCMAIAGGVTLGNANLPFLYMPKSMENSCLTFYNLCTSLASMASAMAAEFFCQMTADHPVSVFGIMLENRAYMNFITCIILLADAGMVWLLYKKKGTEPRSTPTSE